MFLIIVLSPQGVETFNVNDFAHLFFTICFPLCLPFFLEDLTCASFSTAAAAAASSSPTTLLAVIILIKLHKDIIIKFYKYVLGCGVLIKLNNRGDGSTRSATTTTTRKSKLVMENKLLPTMAHGSTCDFPSGMRCKNHFLQRVSGNA
uniref:Uncharacterized protein n=1 Tax=Glossina palpalis gambiensis TaxID=67801 RepID=A0A1B0AME5_9MUSC